MLGIEVIDVVAHCVITVVQLCETDNVVSE